MQVGLNALQKLAEARDAWSGVTSILIVDPTILPTLNRMETVPFELLSDAFPNMSWPQPRGNARAMMGTNKYLTPAFAEELAAKIGCSMERNVLPARCAPSSPWVDPPYLP